MSVSDWLLTGVHCIRVVAFVNTIILLLMHTRFPNTSYELVPTSKNNNNNEQHTHDEDDATTNDNEIQHTKKTCSQFTLRRMACFGSPRYDRREPLHILSADSRFPDVEPKRIRTVGNHFLALFPVTKSYGIGLNQFRNHALLRGGSRIVPPSSPAVDQMKKKEEEEENVQKKHKKAAAGSKWKWDGGRGKWTNNNEGNA